MTLEEAKNIMENEALEGGHFFSDINDAENEVVICRRGNLFVVYATDERASCVTNSEKSFHSEEDALDNFIKRLRARNRVFKH